MTEQERRRLVVLRFVTSALRGEVFDFLHGLTEIDWPGAFLEIFEELAQFPRAYISDDIRRAFLWAWRGDRDQDGSLSLPPVGSNWRIGKDLENNPDLLIRCMKILALPSEGEALQTQGEALPVVVYRGQSQDEYQRGSYGVWWTPDPVFAEWFARNKIRAHVGRGAVIAALLPQSAVIWKLNDWEIILDPKELNEVRLVVSPPRYSPEENEKPGVFREELSQVMGLPPGYDRSAAREWVRQGMRPEGLDRIQALRLADLEQEREAA